ncbi:MAG: carboxypeptidase-like regulatory domain-containing protein, partial [Verrucomicrobia bacterium]|nr:carboxypeptidase-like regulatory domain-containing protein [Verrucomicrobiota bacterium]
MKRRTLITPLTGWLVLTLAPIHAVNAADTSAADAMVRQNGNITGRVINAATTTGLEGADVALEGTIYSARTERDGTYQLQAPTGNYTLTVSYTGLDTQNIPVSIQPGATARQDVGLTAAIYKLGAFVVSGEREGKALAITLQRQAPNVKSVVAADALGVLNGNPGELLKRLPGVMGLDTGGETRFVSIRGMAAALNTVTVDGNRMANAGSAGTSRDFQMQTMVSEGIERMEVVKSPTPDMDGDSIGGAVNFVSATAFDRAAGRRLSGAWGATNRPADKRDQKIHQDYSIAYSEVFWGKLGVTLNYGKHQQLSSISSVTRQYERKATDPAYIYSFALNDFTNLRTRWGGNLRLDYKMSERSRFFFNST